SAYGASVTPPRPQPRLATEGDSVAAERTPGDCRTYVVEQPERRHDDRLRKCVVGVEDEPTVPHLPVRGSGQCRVHDDQQRQTADRRIERDDLSDEKQPDERRAVQERDGLVQTVVAVHPCLPEASRPPAAALPGQRDEIRRHLRPGWSVNSVSPSTRITHVVSTAGSASRRSSGGEAPPLHRMTRQPSRSAAAANSDIDGGPSRTTRATRSRYGSSACRFRKYWGSP